ncbi:MFS transporter [Streptomyces laculatispora]|uniref:MFS transporter n=1 Tax=Streptomyces laculatispora TaxID=887464 RepID=A0ABY9IDA7_9ACTN|nr:MFS transporter [Streptomyces laculatispora]MBO0916230.1 MFS transporter [Streptomyces laculatispora]WLQ44396.1 MFS transporter [Streptomyces laculatispora]
MSARLTEREAGTDQAPPPRGGLRGNRDFRLLWTGETTNRVGINITAVAMPMVATVTLHESVFSVSLLAAAPWLPWLLIGLPAGAWVDRMRRRPIMQICNLVPLVLLASVPVAGWLGILTMTQLLAVALVNGFAAVFFGISYKVYVPSIVEPEDLQEANAKLQGSESVAQVAGLGGGGLLAQAFGATSGLLANSATFLVSALCLSGIRSKEPVPEKPAERPALVQDIKEGLRFAFKDPYLRVLTLYGTATNLVLTAEAAVLPYFILRGLGIPEGATGWLLASSSIGGILGATTAKRVIARFGSARGLLVATVLSAPFALLIPLTNKDWRLSALVVGSAVLSLGVVLANVIQGAFRQRYCPPQLLGRVSASISVANFGVIPIGSVLGGGLGTVLGLRPALWVLTAGLALTPLLLLIGPLRGRRDLPVAPAAR